MLGAFAIVVGIVMIVAGYTGRYKELVTAVVRDFGGGK